MARKESRKAAQILRAGRALPTQRVHPRKRGPGKGEYGHEVSILSRPRWRFGEFLPYLPAKPAVFAVRRKRRQADFATTSRHGQSNSPPAGGETPREQRNPFRNLPPHPPPSGAPSPPGGRLFRRIFVSIRITNVSDEDLTGEVEDCLEFTLNFVQTQGANLTKMSGYFLVKCTFLSVFCVVQ